MVTAPPLTEAQRAAVLREGHTLIAAGAGSGKTTTLVDKIVHALGAERIPGRKASRPCELAGIAAITFTNAAAADLARKLRARLRAVADSCAARGDEREALRWRARVHEVDRARIGTIHSFCGQLLRDVALRIGMDPGFRILDEAETALLRADCAALVLRRALEADGDAMELVAQLGIEHTQTLIADHAREGDLVRETLGAWYEDVEGRIEALAAEITRQRDCWECAEDEGVWREAVDPLAMRLAGTALRLAARVRERMDARLDEEGALDYDALVTRTRDALRDRPDVLAAVCRRLAWLFVDEFQDTDRAQLEIAYLISGFPDRGKGPALCIVGDPKQSIYRFRRADVTLWRRVERDFAAAAIAPIALDTNFRSRAPIVGFVNATFGGLIGAGSAAVLESGHEVSYAELRAFRAAPNDTSAVELLAAGTAGANADERRRAEARAIVGRLHQMMRENGGEEVVWDDGAEAFRPLTWKDVAILFRSRGPIALFEEVLRERGVPYYVAGGSGFFARRETRDLRLLLSALVDARDDVAWLGLLRSPFVGVTDETILRHRARHAEAPLSSLLHDESEGPDAAVLARARLWLSPLRAMRDRVPVSQLILHAVERAAYGARLLTERGGEVALANVRKLLRIAEGRPGDTVADLLGWMEERERGDARDGDAALYTAGEDVVTLTTVHGAKGLEWPVVFLVDLDRKLDDARRKPTLIADPVAGVGLAIQDPASYENAATSGAWECLHRRERAIALAEEKRLWYVAATRARDRLVLCASGTDVGAAEATAVKHWLLRALRPADGYFTYVDGDREYSAGEMLGLGV